MIWLNFQISNPFWKGRNDKPQVDYLSKDWTVSENKFIEVQISKWNPHTIFEITIDTCWFGEDHAGFEINLEIFGFYFAAMLRDKRHWNYDAGRFQTYEEAVVE